MNPLTLIYDILYDFLHASKTIKVLFFLLVCLIIYLVYRLHKAHKKDQLFDYICYCRENQKYMYGIILNLQKEHSIPAKYHIIHNADMQSAEEILSAFWQDLESLYFEGKLLPVRGLFYAPTSRHYFVWALFGYCYQHWADSSIAGHEMHDHIISKRSYDSSMEWDATYALTDFAVVFFKLYYIALHILQESPIPHFKTRATHEDLSLIEKKIDSRCIGILYRQQF